VPFRDRRSFNTNSNAEALDLLKNKFKYELAEIERDNIKVMVGHLAIEGSIPVGDEIDDITNELFCPIDMFVGYEYVFMGHIHTPQIMSKSPFVAHLGSMDISNFSEQNQKKYILLFDPKEVVPYNYIEIPTRSLKQISISVPDNIVDTTNYVINEIKEKHNSLKLAILRLNISFESPDLQNIDRIKVETCLNDLGAFYIAKISEEKKVVLVKKDNALQNMDSTINEAIAIGLFAKMNIDENIRSEFISIANNVVKECTQ
jgi:DNA repair exonuclease SbcCD nuclease subunit